MIPKISDYGQYSKTQATTTKVEIGDVAIYYSYSTPVAFNSPATGLVLSENLWGTTTGKHLGWISRNKSLRIPHKDFLAELEKALAKTVIIVVRGGITDVHDCPPDVTVDIYDLDNDPDELPPEPKHP